MVGGLGDGSHGLHARKSRVALDQERAGEAEAPRTRTDGEERRLGRFALDHDRFKIIRARQPAQSVPSWRTIVEHSTPPY
jgi:hypothetical protein